ncbi:transcriptional repressor LexA [Methylacidimicrobium sp. B4]|uniref:transcriptional repressor LexA n=1 Tax=Methylacidimicrobium sp. B4 TaxID=2796139 RepID=UPI001A90ABA2|nr:transcriptional repressor LexA [Methylacidimicrobium sp. B4]QSR85656.1 repressor LexA [Methylacidimicrobium sp. B4]
MLVDKQGSRTRILRFIESYLQRHHRPPTVREIQHGCGFRSPRAVSYQLERLEAMGSISRQKNSRGILLRKQVEEGFPIPFFPSIPAGSPILAQEPKAETLRLTPESLGVSDRAACFAVRVHGSSMIGAGILDGDLALIERKPAREGQVVAALIDGECTLKRLILDPTHGCVLRSENPAFADLRPARDLSVQGVLVAIVRKVG